MTPHREPSVVPRTSLAAPPAAAWFRLLPVLASLAFLALGWGCAKQKAADAGEKPYTVLDKALQPLRRDFEGMDGKVRLVGILSPTCGECIEIAAALDERILPAIPDEDFQVLIVWVANVPADVETGARLCAERFADPRIHHYWDGSGRIARAWARHAGMPEGSNGYGICYLYGRTDTWDPQGKMGEEPADYNAVLAGWLPADPRVRAGKNPKLGGLPMFRTETISPYIQQLLAEPDAGSGTR
jgi:hypothetical protein